MFRHLPTQTRPCHGPPEVLLDFTFEAEWAEFVYLDTFRLHDLLVMIGKTFSLSSFLVFSSTQLTFAGRLTSRLSREQESIWLRWSRVELWLPTSLYRTSKSSYSLSHTISPDSGSQHSKSCLTKKFTCSESNHQHQNSLRYSFPTIFLKQYLRSTSPTIQKSQS